MTGIMNNEYLERLDFSDNDLEDSKGHSIVKYIKK